MLSGSVLVLQAENEQDMLDWVQSLKSASQMALNSDKAMPEPLLPMQTVWWYRMHMLDNS